MAHSTTFVDDGEPAEGKGEFVGITSVSVRATVLSDCTDMDRYGSLSEATIVAAGDCFFIFISSSLASKRALNGVSKLLM